jgi:hypothetical protein
MLTGARFTKLLKPFYLSVCPIWLPIFSYLSMNEPELGAGIDPGMAFNPFASSIWIRRDSNPQPLDRLLTTRTDLRPLAIFFFYFQL